MKAQYCNPPTIQELKMICRSNNMIVEQVNFKKEGIHFFFWYGNVYGPKDNTVALFRIRWK